MKSEWRVTTNSIGGEYAYAVYRQINVDAVDHSGNREYATGYTSNREDMESLALILNEVDPTDECGGGNQ